MPGRLIFHISAEYGPQSWGGIATAVGLMADGSSENGDQVVILTCGPVSSKKNLPNGVVWITIGLLSELESVLYQSKNRIQIGREFSERASRIVVELSGSRPGLVCIHNEEFIQVADILKSVRNLSIALFSHGLAIQEHPDSKNLINLQNKYLKSGNVIVAHSEAQRALIERELDDVFAYYLPLPLSLLCKPTKKRDEKIVENDLIIAAGRDVPQKGFDILEASFCGSARSHSSRCEVYCRRAIESEVVCSSNENFKYLHWLKSDKLLSRMKMARFLVVPSRFEPLGLIAAEALSCGVPVVFAEVGGLVELVGRDKTLGVGFQTGDIRTSIWNLTSAIENEFESPVISTDGRAYLKRSYSLEQFNRELGALTNLSLAMK